MPDVITAGTPSAADELRGLPDTLRLVRFDGGTAPGGAEDVALFVDPYTFDASSLVPLREMTSLRVVQTLTAGVEHVLPYVPDGVVLCNARGVHDASTAELALTLVLASLRGLAGLAATAVPCSSARREAGDVGGLMSAVRRSR